MSFEVCHLQCCDQSYGPWECRGLLKFDHCYNDGYNRDQIKSLGSITVNFSQRFNQGRNTPHMCSIII